MGGRSSLEDEERELIELATELFGAPVFVTLDSRTRLALEVAQLTHPSPEPSLTLNLYRGSAIPSQLSPFVVPAAVPPDINLPSGLSPQFMLHRQLNLLSPRTQISSSPFTTFS
ncbi:uncharacterized protein JCM15063_001021 [Sporobolomyces koalae]|uniref:uncharacterized protein n=1 Tax=Sporobolomyces koalae TaxID=500713 RepID=UPI0031728957